MNEDSTEEYELLIKGLQSCAEPASITSTRNSDRIPTITKKLLEKISKWSVETNAVLSMLIDQGVDPFYIRTLSDCYRIYTTKIQLFIDL
ncbi:hypothetical protein KIN20_023459 [Parelaphostrongylus tenuis]|uniref:Uncharacterized protein n=1 Tax=Parelaphostrongylus tenuis TaxID=148309 RepID=A0AAD5MRR8_PARTN|nr:hypothetical protein KIN20_023459 [Parelaphostrongylus tenuis]